MNEYDVPVKRILIGVGIVFAVIVGLIAASAATFVSTNSSTAVLVWAGGPLDGRQFAQAVGPGSGRQFAGMMQTTAKVPTGIRQYRVSRIADQGDTPVADSINVSVRGMAMGFEPTVTFTLNSATDTGPAGKDGKPTDTGRPVVVDFVEQQLRQFHATDFDDPTGKWVHYLNERIRPILDDATARTLSQHDPIKLRYNTDGERDKAAAELGEAFSKGVEGRLGRRYFCGPSYAWKGAASTCGVPQVTLPEPKLAPADEQVLAGPQQARTKADSEIAKEQEATRQANAVVEQREAQVAAAQRQSAADVSIKAAEGATADRDAAIKAAYCRALVALGQNCALVIAAEGGHFPTVIGGSVTATVGVPPQ